MKNKVEDLRNHLFETIERLKDGDTTMDVQRAKVIADVAQTIINSAKVEIEFHDKVSGTRPTEFWERPKLASVEKVR